MHLPLPFSRDLVLIGGGHAHALLLKAWGMDPLPGARLTLIDPTPVTAYTGMLPGFVAGHYDREALDIDLVKLARFAGARLILGRAVGLDLERNAVEVEGHSAIPFDVASINVGGDGHPKDLAGFAEFGTACRPMGPFADRWQTWCKDMDATGQIAVLGAGIGGIELGLAMAHRCPKSTVTLIDPGEPAGNLYPRARRALLKVADNHGLSIVRKRPVQVTQHRVHFDDGTNVSADLIVAATGTEAPAWLSSTGLALTDGFISVDRFLRSPSHPNIFAAGDCAVMAHAVRDHAGVFAVRQAPILRANIRAALGAGRPRIHRPQRSYLKLVSLGSKSALAIRRSPLVAGPAIWRWKDRIDRRFMDRLTTFSKMPKPELPKERATGLDLERIQHPTCGGCGAKVGALELQIGLDDTMPGDDAAEIVMGTTRQVISTDHLRAFALDPVTVTRAAAQHALTDILAMGARPQAATTSIILPPLMPELQQRTLREITRTARTTLEEQGAELVGGHTSEGAELTIGFTVTGLLPEGRKPITLNGARPEDALILTKPIGSGTLLAGEMALKAGGRDIANLRSALAVSQAAPAEVLATYARAMTDVTGFGLVGHLLNILRASQVRAEVFTDSIPTFPGARALTRTGIRSSLYQSNRAASAPHIQGLQDCATHHLLFDPQTAGGLLAAVPEEKVAPSLSQLVALGYPAVRIGTVLEGPPEITLIGNRG